MRFDFTTGIRQALKAITLTALAVQLGCAAPTASKSPVAGAPAPSTSVLANNGPARAGTVNPAGASAPTSDSHHQSGLTVIFVRHGETMANYSGHYNGKTLNEFSPRAQKTLDALVQTLHSRQIDSAVVSPQWRTVATAAPVMRDHHLVGTLWPELNECCSQAKSKRGEPARKTILYGSKITPPKGFEDCVKVDPTDPRWIANGNYNDGLAQIKLLVAKFLKTYSGKNETVMVVGHGYCGGRFVESLLGMPPVGRVVPGNAVVIELHQGPDGKFKLVSMKGSELHKRGN